MKPFLRQLKLSPAKNQIVLRNQILTCLQIDQKKVEQFELKVKFDNGKIKRIVKR
ncbi:YusW family protein [Alkalihalobacillus deserti]|uniref:YusW family protein n=1 Tax=Alkalihalobacillus deserti TaxID=2879466 RepID=UPI001D140AEF